MKLTRNFFQASNRLFHYHLTPIQFTVYCYLISCAGSKGYCYPVVKTIAQRCNCSESSVRAATRRLEKLGLLCNESHYLTNRYGVPQQTSNTYRILPMPDYFENGRPVYSEELPL